MTDVAAERRQPAAGPWLAANLGLRFVLELAMLAAFGSWGIHTGHTVAADVLLGLGGPGLAAAVWGTFAAPRSRRRLPGAALTVLQVAMLGLGAAALIAVGATLLGVVMAVAVVVNAVALGAFEG